MELTTLMACKLALGGLSIIKESVVETNLTETHNNYFGTNRPLVEVLHTMNSF